MLSWKVFRENWNNRSIEEFNIFDHGSFYEDMKKLNKKKNITKEEFVEQMRKSLMYYMWSRCEYEVIVAGFPTHITKEELDRLSSEYEEYNKKWGHYPYKIGVNLDVESKIDIYDQVMLNWIQFAEYVWTNRKELK